MSESSPFILSGAERRALHSNVVDQDYEVSIAVLADVQPDVRYPVLYMTDANSSFAWVAQAVRLMQIGQELPELVLVGIGYPIGSMLNDPSAVADWAALRRRDFFPPVGEYRESGRAPLFLEFIQEELMPLINSEYPVDPSDAALLGGSAGGAFSLYALLSSPDTFRRYLADSPWIHGCIDTLFKLEESLAERTSHLPASLFMGAGALEPDPMIPSMRRMDARLRERGYTGFDLTTMVFDDETHVSVVGPCYARGLKAIYADALATPRV